MMHVFYQYRITSLLYRGRKDKDYRADTRQVLRWGAIYRTLLIDGFKVWLSHRRRFASWKSPTMLGSPRTSSVQPYVGTVMARP